MRLIESSFVSSHSFDRLPIKLICCYWSEPTEPVLLDSEMPTPRCPLYPSAGTTHFRPEYPDRLQRSIHRTFDGCRCRHLPARPPPPGSIPTHSTITLRSLIRNGFACSLTLIGHTSAASDSQQCSNGIKAAPRGQFITGSTWFQIGLSHSLRRGARTRLNTAARGH